MDYMNKIKNILFKIMTHISAGILFLIAIPFMLFYTIIKSFWIIFGSTIIAFIIIAILGGTMMECLTYSSSLGFFVSVYLKYRESK